MPLDDNRFRRRDLIKSGAAGAAAFVLGDRLTADAREGAGNAPIDFVHLNVHSDSSLHDGLCRIDDLCRAVREKGMRTVALTDHGNLSGAVEFYLKAYMYGVKPIIGCEVYVAAGSRLERPSDDVRRHLTLLASDEDGYLNLMRLVASAQREGLHRVPRVDKDLLARHAKGLVVLTGCSSGELAELALQGRYAEAEALCDWFIQIYGRPHVFVEVQRHGLEDEDILVRRLVGLARRADLPVVATNNVHYLNREDAAAHDVLRCIGAGKRLDEPGSPARGIDQLYMKTPAEMARVFRDLPEALRNTLAVAEHCNCEIRIGKRHLPAFVPPDGKTAHDYLRELAEAGLRRRYGKPAKEARERLDYELRVLGILGLERYVLFAWDLVRFAREAGIPAGPVEGACSGSLALYAIGLTVVDPLRHGLLFERSFNLNCSEIPDLGLFFGHERVDEIVAYAKAAYGGDRVSRVAAFRQMSAQEAIRQTGRVLDIDEAVVNRVAGKVPRRPPVARLSIDRRLRHALETSTGPAGEATRDPRIARLLDIAARIEGVRRDAVPEPGILVVTDRPLTDCCPHDVSGPDNLLPYDAKTMGLLGLARTELSGLEALTLADAALRRVAQRLGVRPDLDAIPLDDATTYRFLRHGPATDCFLFDAKGMADLLMRIRPDCFEDLIAAVAMFHRSAETGLATRYIEGKQGRKPEIPPALEPFLRESHGVLLYQEQLMRIARGLAGFSTIESDTLRRVLAKSMPEVAQRYREWFVDGAARNGIAGDAAGGIFDWIRLSARDLSCKAQDATYALIGYRAAFLEAHYPREYIDALTASYEPGSES
jgi:DNA polymerase-3 subunit alpha